MLSHNSIQYISFLALNPHPNGFEFSRQSGALKPPVRHGFVIRHLKKMEKPSRTNITNKWGTSQFLATYWILHGIASAFGISSALTYILLGSAPKSLHQKLATGDDFLCQASQCVRVGCCHPPLTCQETCSVYFCRCQSLSITMQIMFICQLLKFSAQIIQFHGYPLINQEKYL